MYAIINQYRTAEGEMVVSAVVGPFATRADAEEHNQTYPSPDYNRIVRFYTPEIGGN